MLKKLRSRLFIYFVISSLAILIPLTVTPHMELHEGQVKFSISKIIIIASFISLIGSFSLMNLLPVVLVKKGKFYLDGFVPAIVLFYLLSSLASLILLSAFLTIILAIKVVLLSLSTMMFTTLVIYHQSLQNNKAVLSSSFFYYLLFISTYFIMSKHFAIDWSRIWAQTLAVFILWVSQINNFEFKNIFNLEHWKKIWNFSKSIFLHLVFGILLTYLDKFFVLFFIQGENQTKYAFLYLYFLPFAAFYNQLFNSFKPELYLLFEKGISITRYFYTNVLISAVGTSIYSFLLYLYLVNLNIEVQLNIFIVLALITWTWTHYLLPASILVYANKNRYLSVISIKSLVFGVILLSVCLLFELKVLAMLYTYISIVIFYNFSLKIAANGLQNIK